MEKSIQYSNLYFSSLAKIYQAYPKSELIINRNEQKELLYEIKIPEEPDEDELLKIIIGSNKPAKLIFNSSIVNIIDYLEKLKNNKQNSRFELFHKYLLYDTFYTTDKNEICYLDTIILDNKYANQSIKPISKEIDKILEDIKEINYCLWGLEKNLDYNDDNFLSEDKDPFAVNILLTYLFINLNGIINNLKENSEVSNLLAEIIIEEYTRFQFGKKQKIRNFDELIKHYRDAVSHSENSKSDIKKSSAGNVLKLLIQNITHDTIITYGDGILYFNKHLKYFIKKLKNNFLPLFKLITIHDENGKELFYDLYFYYLNCPMRNNIFINKLKDDIYSIHFQKNW